VDKSDTQARILRAMDLKWCGITDEVAAANCDIGVDTLRETMEYAYFKQEEHKYPPGLSIEEAMQRRQNGNLMFQAYAAANESEINEWHDSFGWYFTYQEARERVNAALKSGRAFGYIKLGFETISHLTMQSFVPTEASVQIPPTHTN